MNTAQFNKFCSPVLFSCFLVLPVPGTGIGTLLKSGVEKWKKDYYLLKN